MFKERKRKSVVLGLLMVILGFYLMICYISKVLPFGLNLSIEEATWLWSIWAYGGWLFVFMTAGAGLTMIVEAIDSEH